MPVNTGNEFARHTKGSFLIVHVATGRTKTAFAGIGNKFKFSAVGATPKSSAMRGVTTVNHLVNVIDDSLARMQNI